MPPVRNLVHMRNAVDEASCVGLGVRHPGTQAEVERSSRYIQSEPMPYPVVNGYGASDRTCGLTPDNIEQLNVPVPGVSIGTYYHFAVWMRDSAGLTSQR